MRIGKVASVCVVAGTLVGAAMLGFGADPSGKALALSPRRSVLPDTRLPTTHPPAAAAGAAVGAASQAKILSAVGLRLCLFDKGTPRQTAAPSPLAAKAFVPLSWSQKSEVFKAVGILPQDQSPGGENASFLLTPRAPYVDGRGWIDAGGGVDCRSLNLWSSQGLFGTGDSDGFVALSCVKAPQVKTGFLCDVQVCRSGAIMGDLTFVVENLATGGEYTEPCSDLNVHHLIMFVPLQSPAEPLVWWNQVDGNGQEFQQVIKVSARGEHRGWELIGIEVTLL